MATVNFIRYKEQSAGALKGVAEYVAQEGKIWDEASGQRLVSGQNCSPQFACREFKATRSAWRKDSPVWFYHYTQSFHPDEKVNGPTAHQIAQEFAARAWPDSEVLIAPMWTLTTSTPTLWSTRCVTRRERCSDRGRGH